MLSREGRQKVGERISHGHRHMLRSSGVRRERKEKKGETKMVCLQRRDIEYQCQRLEPL